MTNSILLSLLRNRNKETYKVMKTKLIVLTVIFTCISFFTGIINAQDKYKLSAYYKYSIKYEIGKFDYPLGFGCAFSKAFSNKLILTTGLEYSHLLDKYQKILSPAVYRTEEIQRESVFSFIAGVAYPVLEKKITISIGSDIISSYILNSLELYRYTVADGLLDLHDKYYNNAMGFGVKLKTDLQYILSDGISVFIQPGYTYYLFGEAKKENILSASAGLVFIL